MAVNPISALCSFASTGSFAARGFLSTFLIAMLLRFGDRIPILNHFGLLAHLHHGQPTWFTANATLVVLGILALVEVLAHKNTEARMLLNEFDLYVKPMLAALTSLGILSVNDAGFVRETVHQAGFGELIVPLLTAVGTYQLASLRKKIVTTVFSQFDGTRVGSLLSWTGDFWVLFSVLFTVLFAAGMLVVLAIVFGVLFIIRKRVEIAEEHRRMACSKCGTLVYPCAPACAQCGQKNEQPRDVGFFGQSTDAFADDLADHPYRLAEKRRCPNCAARLPLGHPFQECRVCRKSMLSQTAFYEGYSQYIGRRAPMVVGLCLPISAVPIIGMLVGTLYYEIMLANPLSQYLPLGQRMLLKWEVRLLFWLMAILQMIPGVGVVAVPVMAWVTFSMHKRRFLNTMNGQHEKIVKGGDAGSFAPA